jgi:Spy/CpxP family protein refolding chaperone
VLLVFDTELVSELGIDSRQMKQMREVVSKTDREMIPTLQKFGREFISGYGANETEQDRIREMNELIPRLQQMMRQRDNSILQILTAQQRNQFETRQGKPLSIRWDSWEFMRIPFEKKDS